MKSRSRGKKILGKLIENRKYWCYTVINITYLYKDFFVEKERKCFRGLRRALQRTAIEINLEWNERQSLAEDFAEGLCQSGNCGG